MEGVRKKNIIRTLVIISALSYVIWVFGRLVLWQHFDENVQRLLDADGYGTKLPEHEFAYVPWVFISLLSYMGLLLFRRWGRDLLVAVYILTLVLSPFSGVMIHVPYERFFFTVFMLSDGMILGLLFFAWKDEFFDNSRQSE
jgi:hypothetical protein